MLSLSPLDTASSVIPDSPNSSPVTSGRKRLSLDGQRLFSPDTSVDKAVRKDFVFVDTTSEQKIRSEGDTPYKRTEVEPVKVEQPAEPPAVPPVVLIDEGVVATMFVAFPCGGAAGPTPTMPSPPDPYDSSKDQVPEV